MNTPKQFAAIVLLAAVNIPLAAFSQGNLTPPGAPAPTMKTLDQVEARTPITNSTTGLTISQPGSYYLTRNLTVSSGTAITIATNGVTLDLNGFTISSTAPSATGSGIYINSGLRDITICNGHIRGGVTNDGSGEYVCSGHLWAANVGWISLGGGAPANGIRYQNNSASDFGVNHDGLGNLRGYAFGANIGWIAFETNGAPRVDLATGKLSGYAYSANCGWISLSNAQAVVQTAYIARGTDSDADGIADAWERTYTNTLAAFTATSDTDGDGQSDLQEALADTNPLDPNDLLRITAITREAPPGTYTTLRWSGKMTRFYAAQRRDALGPTNAWDEFFTSTWPGATQVGFDISTPQQFFRIRAFRPLMD